MVAKEKAKELVENMFNVDLKCDNEAMCMLYPHEIKCALIAVDEIIKANPHSTPTIYGVPPYSTIKYWEEVKQEIEQL